LTDSDDTGVWDADALAEYIRKNHFIRYYMGTTMYEFDKLAIMTAILYAARWQRRVPESDAETRGAIAGCIANAKLILVAVREDEAAHTTPEQPPPSPGTIGRIADAKATRRRG
jgi:hypothetical protein